MCSSKIGMPITELNNSLSRNHCSNMHSRPSLVVITGANGHVGFSILVEALRAGKCVRAVVRSEAKLNQLRSHPIIQQAARRPGALSFAVVSDITRSTSFAEAFKDATEIIHTASPIPNTGSVPRADYNTHFVNAAVFGTQAVLKAAARVSTVRRIIITNSIVALIPIAQLEGRETRSRAVQPSDRISFQPGSYESEFHAYAASKVAALAVAERWVKRAQPHFDVVHLHPSFVKGRKHLYASDRELLQGGNTVMLGSCIGKRFEGGFIGATVHNDDVARAHIRALNPRVPGNRSYILSQESRWEDIPTIVAEEFPHAIDTGLLRLSEPITTIEMSVNTEDSIELLGIDFRDFRDQVTEVVAQYLEARLQRRVRCCAGSCKCSTAQPKRLIQVRA